MSTAKGSPEMAKPIEQIQKVIMKPEWKQLVDSVLSEVDITKKTQESVISVTNAIVTPLSLLIHAAGLSQEDIEHCYMIWQETMKMLGAKCVERESKAIQVERSALTLRKLEELGQYDREVRKGLDNGQLTPIQKEDIRRMAWENRQARPGPAYDFGGEVDGEPITIDSQSTSDQTKVQGNEQTAPPEDSEVEKKDQETETQPKRKSPAAKRAIDFTSTESESSEDESEDSLQPDSKEHLNTAINAESSTESVPDCPEFQRLNQVSDLEKLGWGTTRILAKSVAKKSLVMDQSNNFRIKSRKVLTQNEKVKLR